MHPSFYFKCFESFGRHSYLLPLSAGIGIFILGESLHVFSNPTPRMKKFQKAGVSFIDGLGPMFAIIPWYKLLPTPASVRFLECVHTLEEITKELIEEKIVKLSQLENPEEECVGFLEQWLLNDNFTKKDMYVLVRDFLSAGIDTVCSYCVKET